MVAGAQLVYDVENVYLQDATAKLKIEAVSFTDEISGIFPPVYFCDDRTVIVSPGLLRRTLYLVYTPDFSAAFPTTDERIAALTSRFENVLAAGLPARVKFRPDLSNFDLCNHICP